MSVALNIIPGVKLYNSSWSKVVQCVAKKCFVIGMFMELSYI